MQSARRRIVMGALGLVWVLSCVISAQEPYKAVYGSGKTKLRLATGSPGELGLLKVIAEAFAKEHDATVCWRKAGSGKSLKLLRGKEVDIAMVHAPAAEKEAVAEGWAACRTLIGSNEFFVVGPTDDPAGIRSAKTVAAAYRRIASARAKFFSRGDNSGTHKKELAIWEKAGIEPKGEWYVITKDFMAATLLRANTEKGYFMTDSSTWFVEQKNCANLKVLFRGDPFLINVYHALCQPAGATEAASLAKEFVDFLASEKGQCMIRDYGKEAYGQPLYNDAVYAKRYE